jgi:16S rRNA (guanine527-N7)-methyltransferase
MPGALKPLGTGFLPLICEVARGLGAELDAGAASAVVTWFDLIATWNAKVDLTAARSAEELADLMLADALVVARHEGRDRKIVDVGSGAGGPGLALHLARPDLFVTLVEPLQKRVSFLRTVAGHLAASGSDRLRIVRGRGEDLSDGEFETAISRATLAPDAWVRLGTRLVKEEGAVWVLLAREAPPEVPGWRIAIDEDYAWPLTGARRRALRYERA